MKHIDRRLLIVNKLISAAKIEHYSCEEDNWYSCPKSKNGCSNDDIFGECNCGADNHNLIIDLLKKELSEYIRF